jgi:hypothetical protein
LPNAFMTTISRRMCLRWLIENKSCESSLTLQPTSSRLSPFPLPVP